MNIILVSDKPGKNRTITFGSAQIALSASALLSLTLLLAGLLYYFTVISAVDIGSPYLQALITKAREQEAKRSRVYVQDSLNAMAIKVGQMQAQMLRLDGLGEQLAKRAGFKPQDFSFDRPAPEGGPESGMPQRDLSLEEFRGLVDKVSVQIDDHGDQLAVLNSILSQEHLRNTLLPSGQPVAADWHSSDFGWRIDPFTGRKAFHPGIDFAAEVGTPIYAAAGGVVVDSYYNPEYGNMIDIDHGNGLISRYAHASKRLVKVGDIVLRGQKIAEVGSTGRSTGPHLHFEVRYQGVAQNPAKFLLAARNELVAKNLARQYQAAR